MISNLLEACNVALLSLAGLVGSGCDYVSRSVEPLNSPSFVNVGRNPIPYFPVDYRSFVGYTNLPTEFTVYSNPNSIPGANETDIEVDTYGPSFTHFYFNRLYFPTSFSVNYGYVDSNDRGGFSVGSVTWHATDDLTAYQYLNCGFMCTLSGTTFTFISLYYDYVSFVTFSDNTLLATGMITKLSTTPIVDSVGITRVATAYTAPSSNLSYIDLWNNGINYALAPYFWRLMVSSVYSTSYSAGYEAGKNDGIAEGYEQGKYDGYAQAQEDHPSNVITSLFGAVVSVPMKVLAGLSVFTVFDTPVIGILVTLMFIGFILWFIKRFI